MTDATGCKRMFTRKRLTLSLPLFTPIGKESLGIDDPLSTSERYHSVMCSYFFVCLYEKFVTCVHFIEVKKDNDPVADIIKESKI